jgi:hypothetical protein
LSVISTSCARGSLLLLVQARDYDKFVAILPGTDPVSMLIQMVPLVLLYELSIWLARMFRPKGDQAGFSNTSR